MQNIFLVDSFPGVSCRTGILEKFLKNLREMPLSELCCSEVVELYQPKKIVTDVWQKVSQNFSEKLPGKSFVKL